MTNKVLSMAFVIITASRIIAVDEEAYTKKTLDAMILQTLWDRVYAMQDVTTKQNAIKKLRQSGHYDSLIVHLTKAKKDKVKKILDLTAEIMIAYLN